MQRRILVTGGAGFLGSHLCERLHREGNDVWCLDNLTTGRVANISGLLQSPRFNFVEADVRDRFPDLEIDRIFNLACPASPPTYQADPIGTMLTSVNGAVNALELARSAGAILLQASTSEVYGDPEVHPQPESYNGSVNCKGIRACYDEGKRAAETLCFDYRRKHGTSVRVARLFNSYGPRMARGDGRVVPNLVHQALAGAALTIYGDGSQTRSFCYVDDTVDGLIALMEKGHDDLGPVNLGNPHEFTMLELASEILGLTGSNSELTFAPLPPDDPKLRCPVIDLARASLSWDPRVSLREGLARTIDHVRRQMLDKVAK